MPKKIVRRRPFFLLEVLVAMAIFSLAILPLLTMQWGVYNAERGEARQFALEMGVKHEAIQTLQAIYSRKYRLEQLREGIALPTTLPGITGKLYFEEEKEGVDGFIVLQYPLQNLATREFSLHARVVKNPQS